MRVACVRLCVHLHVDVCERERERERERVCGALELIWKAVNLIMCHSWGSTKDYSKAEVLSL